MKGAGCLKPLAASTAEMMPCESGGHAGQEVCNQGLQGCATNGYATWTIRLVPAGPVVQGVRGGPQSALALTLQGGLPCSRPPHRHQLHQGVRYEGRHCAVEGGAGALVAVRARLPVPTCGGGRWCTGLHSAHGEGGKEQHKLSKSRAIKRDAAQRRALQLPLCVLQVTWVAAPLA